MNQVYVRDRLAVVASGDEAAMMSLIPGLRKFFEDMPPELILYGITGRVPSFASICALNLNPDAALVDIETLSTPYTNLDVQALSAEMRQAMNDTGKIISSMLVLASSGTTGYVSQYLHSKKESTGNVVMPGNGLGISKDGTLWQFQNS